MTQHEHWGARCAVRLAALLAVGLLLGSDAARAEADGAEKSGRKPNILFAIADDWSWPHASIAGTKGIATPNFDRVAREGALLTHAYCAAPQCSPNRAAILTGRHIGQLEEAGTHSSLFPKKYKVYPELLKGAGYHVGFTGKGWGPGNWKGSGRSENPAGEEYSSLKLDSVPASGISRVDYAGNFEAFLAKRPEGAPFCFWYGGHEPHRGYEEGSGAKAGKDPADPSVPSFLPDDGVVRGDLLDYFLEVEWFDAQLGAMLRKLEALGELDNTIVVVTGDNGMSFPRAKANIYEYGVRVPLAVRWGERVKPGRTADDLISVVDLAPTFLEAAGVAVPGEVTGKSLLGMLTAGAAGPNDFVLFGRERHSHARHDNLGYPARAIRTREYLYIHNFAPERWPAGDPERYYDIDDGPAKTQVVAGKETAPGPFELSVGKRPEEELYAVGESMDCMDNLAESEKARETKDALRGKLDAALTALGDPRVSGKGDVFDSYPRFGGMRPELGGFAKQGVYNPAFQEAK